MKRISLALFIALAAATPASAHFGPAAHGSFAAGLLHPLSGADHILAMVGVGLWAALLGGRALLLVPAAFVCTMLLGFAAAVAGVGLPLVEPAVAASVVVLGLFVLVAFQTPTALAMAVVGAFALFHGHAHGSEMGEAGALRFMGGFALATALLHAAGLAIGLGVGRFAGGRLVARAAGGLTALGGLWLMAGA